MLKNIYRIFIGPRQQNEDLRNRELVLNILLFSTLLVTLLYMALLLQSYFLLEHRFVMVRIAATLVGMVFVGLLYKLSRGGRYRLAALLLLGTYLFAASAVACNWGVALPTGVLLFGLIIIVAGILLGSVYSLYASGAVTVLLVVLQLATENHILHPDLSWATTPPDMSDVISFGVLFGILAVVSWLFNHQMERSLKRAKRAEAALKAQKAALKETVNERTRQLQAEQLERTQQMYRFAELGQLSTALMHELANHLTTLTLDIEGLKAKNRTGILKRAKRSIRYIDDMVKRVRDQLRGKDQARVFNIVDGIGSVVSILHYKASQAQVDVLWQPPEDKRGLRCLGAPIRFRQLTANLLSNAIEAYDDKEPPATAHHKVRIVLSVTDDQIIIAIHDWGKGISRQDRAKLFEPFFSTKKTGMGMGLFTAKQIAEDHLGGRLKLDIAKKHTVFTLNLPRVGI